MMQHSQSTGSQQSQQNQKKVQSWLMGEGWQVGEEHPPEVTWAWTASDRGGRKIVVFQPRDKLDVVMIQAGVITDDNVRRHMGAMPTHERNRFYADLIYALLEMGVEYAGVSDPFETVVVTQRMYFEALVRDAFIQRVILVRNAQVMVLVKIQSLIKQPPPAPTELPPMGFHPDKS